MSLYDIVEHVNSEVDEHFDDPDYQLAFATNSACISVASEMCEVLVSYKETPPDRVMVEHLNTELERRINILNEQLEALNKYELD